MGQFLLSKWAAIGEQPCGQGLWSVGKNRPHGIEGGPLELPELEIPGLPLCMHIRVPLLNRAGEWVAFSGMLAPALAACPCGAQSAILKQPQALQRLCRQHATAAEELQMDPRNYCHKKPLLPLCVCKEGAGIPQGAWSPRCDFSAELSSADQRKPKSWSGPRGSESLVGKKMMLITRTPALDQRSE